MSYTKVRTSTQVNIDANLDIQTHKIINVVDPTNAQDVATKNYVDTHATAAPSFVDNETPTGTVDGVNVTFTLANVPILNSEHLFLNGIRQLKGVNKDYTITSDTVTFVAAPITGDILLADYRK